MQTNLFNFYTSKNNLAVKAVVDPALEKMNSMEKFARNMLRLTFESLLLVNQQPENRHKYAVDISDRVEAAREYIYRANGIRLTDIEGMKSTEDVYVLINAITQGALSTCIELIKWQYPNATIPNKLKGLDRALFDGVSSYMIERAMFLLVEILGFYKYYKHLNSPFLIDVTDMCAYAANLRDIAKSTGDARFYGMMANDRKTRQLRHALYPQENADLKFYGSQDDELSRLDPVAVRYSNTGHLLGILWAYFSATNNGDKPSEMIGYPRLEGLDKIELTDKFYMSLTKVEHKRAAGDLWLVTFGLADAQQMSFFVKEETAQQMLEVKAMSTL